MNYEVIAASIKKTIIGRKTKSLIAALLLAASSAFAQVPSYVPTNGLVGWWPFNGNANDESGNGNNGTVNGAIQTTDRNNQSLSAYSFGCSNGYDEIYIPYNPNFNSPTITVSAWYNSSTLFCNGYEHTIIKRFQYGYNNPNGETWGILLNPNSTLTGFVKKQSPTTQGYIYSSGPSSVLNQWVNVVLSFDGVLLKQYVNGQLYDVDSSAGFLLNTTGNSGLSIGVSNQANGFWGPFDGKIDDIGFWNRALSQQEITALYNAQSCTGTGAIIADGPTTFCAGNYVNLTSDVVGGTYQWKKNGVNISTNATSRTYKATATGTYTCVATCNGTALTSNAIQVTTKTNAFASVTASGATSFCAGDSVTLNCTNLGSNYSVQWYRTNISMENSTNYSQVVKQPGTYKVVTKNLTTGCSRISSGSITTAVNCRISNPGIIAVDPVNNEMPATKLGNSTETTMHLFPNPNAGSFTLEYDGIEADFEVQIVNTMGQVIYNDIVPSNDKHLKTTINLGDNMQKGIYVVRIINGEEVHESKVMLQ